MEYSAHKAWLIKTVGPANGETPDHTADQENFNKRNTYIDANLGDSLAQTRNSVKAALAGIRVVGSDFDREVLAKRKPGERATLDTQQDEYDTQAEAAHRIDKIARPGGEPVDIQSEAGQAIVAEINRAMEPIIQKSQEMAAKVDAQGKPLFTAEDIEKDLWMPLVREGIVPSNFVPDQYSQTMKVFSQGSALYQQLMDREEGSSMGPDPVGRALQFAKYTVKVGSLIGAQAIHYADLKVTEASREDFAKFIAGKGGTSIAPEDVQDLNTFDEIDGLTIDDVPEGMTLDELKEARFEEAFGQDANGAKLSPEDLTDKLAALRKDNDAVNKLERIAHGPGGAENREEWLADLSERGKPRPIDMVRDNFLEDAEAGGNPDYGAWLEAENKRLTGLLATADESDRATLEEQLTAVEGAQLTQAFGEHVQHKAALNLATTLGNTGIESVERYRERQKRDVAERLLEGVADVVRDAIFLGVSGEDLAFDPQSRQTKHETKYATNAVKLFIRSANQLSKALAPGSSASDRDIEKLISGMIGNFLESLGEGASALGHIHGGDMDHDGDGDSRDDAASFGMIGKSAGVLARAYPAIKAAIKNRDPAALTAELTAIAAGAPSAYFAGVLGDVTREDRELDEVQAATGGGDDRAFAASPFIEVHGAAGQTDFGFSGDLATVADQRSVIEETEAVIEGIDKASRGAVFKALERTKATLALHPGRTPDEAAEAWLDEALQSDNPQDLDPDKAKEALAHLRRTIDEAVNKAHTHARLEDERILENLSDSVDKDSLRRDMGELRDMIEAYDNDEEVDPAEIRERFEAIQNEVLKDERVVAEIQGELDSEEAELEALKARADMSRLEGIADPQEREAQRQEALEAIETLTKELKAAEKRAKMFDQATKGALTVVLAAVPGAGLAMKIRNLVASSYKAEKRRRELTKWKRQMEAMSGNYSAYEFAAAGEVDVLEKARAHDLVEVFADVAGVTAEALRLMDQTHIGAAAATSVEKIVRTFNEIWFDIYGKTKIANGWAAFKAARSDPKNRRQAREAIRLNTTFAKCVLAYGACIDKDPQAQNAVQACGLTPEVFENTNDVCNAVVEYLRVRVMDKEFETIADHTDVDWMPCPAAPTLRNWALVKTAASKLDPALANLSTGDIDRAMRAFEAPDLTAADKLQRGEDLRALLKAYGPKDGENRVHTRMKVATAEFALAVRKAMAPAPNAA